MPVSSTGPTRVSNMRLNCRASVRSHSGVSPGCLLGASGRTASSARWSARKRCLQVRQSTSGSVKPPTWPEASQTRGCRMIDGVERDDVVPLPHHRLEPARLDVLLQQHAVVAVVVRASRARRRSPTTGRRSRAGVQSETILSIVSPDAMVRQPYPRADPAWRGWEHRRSMRLAERAGIAFALHEYEHDPRAESYGLEAAEKLGVDPARVFKTLVVGRRRHAARSRSSRSRPSSTSGRSGSARRWPTPAAAERATGYVAGGISPLGQRRALPTVARRVGARVRDDLRERGPARARDGACPRGSRPPDGREGRARSRAARLRAVSAPVELHIVSDSTGETAARLVLALEAQFPEQAFEVVRHPRVEIVDDLHSPSPRRAGRPAVMVYTLVEPGPCARRCASCAVARALHYCDLLGHPIDSISRVAGVAARMEPGARAPLDQTYFKRIEAIEFAVKYDDGDARGLDEADVVLVGVSRTSKTPLSIYLGYLGHKAANVPIVKGVEPPAELFEIDRGEDRRPDDRPRAPRRDPRRARAVDGRAEPPLRRSRGRDLRGARHAATDPAPARAAPCSTSPSSPSRRPRCGSSAWSTQRRRRELAEREVRRAARGTAATCPRRVGSPLRYWVLWWALIGVADVLFYVVLTPDLDGAARGRVGGRAPLARSADDHRADAARRPEEGFDLARASGAGRRGSARAARVALAPAGRSCEGRSRDGSRRPSRTPRSDSRLPFQSSSRSAMRRTVRRRRRGSQTRSGRSSQTTVSAASSTRSPSFPR